MADAVTAETFKLFDKLIRGLEVAKEAHENAVNDLNGVIRERDQIEEGIAQLQDEIATLRPLGELAQLVLDVDRGIRTVDELITYTKGRYT